MKRSKLRAHVRQLATELEGKSYEHWASQKFPIDFQRVLDGVEIQVEIDLLQKDEEHMHFVVQLIGSGPFSAYFPVGTDFIVYKSDDEERKRGESEQPPRTNDG